ncbi:hypothetical protein MC45_01965 [Sphingomonas taxi]|uniref:Uncharacterized protein n=1 Tax=Sphingomonas taxi TaxID=1549858 RepID=A0A097ECS5_9SPHN|nr:hypothetical protein [Sphingomonas taxi]AIT05374.1 hypothetical protein MC45_01965 [Sphingomonas taxi]
MTEPVYTLYDVRDYPIVRFVGEATEGYATRWCAEMDRLLADGGRFVLIYPPRRQEEAHADRVARGQWLKHNKTALAERCLAVIAIEPDAARRAEMEAMYPNLVKAFGTPQAVRATAAEAERLARHLLAGGGLSDGV